MMLPYSKCPKTIDLNFPSKTPRNPLDRLPYKRGDNLKQEINHPSAETNKRGEKPCILENRQFTADGCEHHHIRFIESLKNKQIQASLICDDCHQDRTREI